MYWVISDKPEDNISGSFIEGILLNSNQELIPEVLYDQQSVIDKHKSFNIKILMSFGRTRIGLITDRMILKTNEINHFVVSKRLKEFLEKEINSVEYIPCHFIDRDLGHQYYIVHPLSKIDCLDEEKSSYTPLTDTDNTICEINWLGIDESKVPSGLQLFLLGRTDYCIMLMHNDLKIKIEDNGFTGCSYLEPLSFSL